MIRDMCRGRNSAGQKLGIIFEERSKMNKKKLNVAVAALFVSVLTVTANVQGKQVQDLCTADEKWCRRPAAGICLALSDYSFTTESDEKTGIEKKEEDRVGTGNGDSGKLTDGKNCLKTMKYERNAPVKKRFEAEKTADRKGNRWNISLTEDEINLLAGIVWLEARGEPVEGQEAVVEVVLNRMASELFPNTLYDVLSQGNPTQFCSWKSRNSAQPTEKEYQSLDNVLNGNTNILRNDTLYFSREALTPNLDKRIGDHSFCY